MHIYSIMTLGLLGLASPVAALEAGMTSGSSRTAGQVVLWDSIGGISGAATASVYRIEGGLIPSIGGLSLPSVSSIAKTVAAGQTVMGILPVVDGDGDTVTYSVAPAPTKGVISFSASGFSFAAYAHGGGVETLALTADDGNGNRTFGSLTITVVANQRVVRAFVPSLSAPYQLTVGTPVVLSVIGGTAPLRFSSSTAKASATGTIRSDVDGDGQLDQGVSCLLEATTEGAGSLSITDALGANLVVSFTAIAPPPVRPPAPRPVIPTSQRTQALFGCLGAQTTQGVASLRRAFAGLNDTQAVAYAWDAGQQAFIQLPTEPTGGLTPGLGVFIASRVDLPVDFTGTPARLPYEWSLQPGWNFLAIPLLADGADAPVSSLDPQADVTLREADGTELLGDDRVAAFSGNWWSFDGQNYQQVTSLQPGLAYWVRNRTDNVRPLVLSLTPGVGARMARRSSEGSRPPVPPSSAGSEGSSGGSHGCGVGGGIAAIVGVLTLMGRRRRASA